MFAQTMMMATMMMMAMMMRCYNYDAYGDNDDNDAYYEIDC